MAKAHKCDFCNEYRDGEANERMIGESSIDPVGFDFDYHIDLCDICLEEFLGHIENKLEE